jgi:HJR/Mrr/RecB family endonuclease
MANRRRSSRKYTEDMVKGVLGLSIFAYFAIANWWKTIPKESRVILLVLTTIIVLGSIGAIIAFSIYKKRERVSAWRRAMADWQNKEQGELITHKLSAIYMSDVELEKFAAQVYKKMGYKVQRTGNMGDHGIDVMLVNPKNQKEIVQCKQWNKPIGEPVVRDLYGAMMHENAVRGWMWAPRGFSKPAQRWAKGKSIVLVDDKEISRLIEIAFGNKK